MYKNNIYNAINMSIYSNTCLSIEREQKIRMTEFDLSSKGDNLAVSKLMGFQNV